MLTYPPNVTPVDFDPFAGPEIASVTAAIEPQLEIWASCMLGGDDSNRAFNESVSLLLTGPFHPAALEFALNDLISRHEALRAVFSADGMSLFIYKQVRAELLYEDLSFKNPLKQQQYLLAFARKNARTPFLLQEGPLFRSALFKLAENEHYLTLTAHHIICDGWSLGILMQDLAKLYSAYVRGEVPSLPEAFQLSQYAVEQQAFLSSNAYQSAEAYWVGQYQDHVPVLNMPTDFPHPFIRTYKSQRDDYPVDPQLVDALRKMGAKAGCSLVTTLLAAFEICLFRITGQQDMVLGLPVSGQATTGHYSLVGHCVNLLAMRSQISKELSFPEYLKQRKVKILADYDHQQFTFGSLLKKLNIARDPSRVPLVPVVFNIDMNLDDGVEFHGLKHKLIYNARAFENFELFLNATGSAHSLILEWSYNKQLFKSSSIRRMMNDFELLLESITKEPQRKIKDIPSLLNPGQYLPKTAADYPKHKTVAELFAEQAARTPEKIALAFEGSSFTYRRLNEMTNQLGHYLKGKGVSAESLVPIVIERSPEMIIAILGILKAGGAYVPVDPEYPAERIQFMLDDVDCRIILGSRNGFSKIPAGNRHKMISLTEEWEEISLEPVTGVESNAGPSSLAYVMYTSGSTGKPKGVMIENRNIVSLVKNAGYVPLNEKSILLSTGSPSFDASTFEYWGMLLNGGQLLISNEQVLLNGSLLKKEITSRKVNIMWFTSSLLNQWIDLDMEVFEGLEIILAGGEKLSEKHVIKLITRYPKLTIINGYGPTENTTFSLTFPITEKETTGDIPIGRPLNNRTAYILNPQGAMCPTGVTGELFVGGAGVGRGYLRQPGLTKERFLPDPFGSEAYPVMYKTGDLARWIDPETIAYMGRMDEQVKIRGFRIELGEIETVLKQHSHIKDCAVVAPPDKEGQLRLVAYVVPQPSFNKDELNAFLKTKLPDYMVPRLMVALDQLPLTANGKTDRKALSAREGLIKTDRGQNKEGYTRYQKMIAGIFAEALRLEEVDKEDDFFELGGNSLMAIKVMRLLEEHTAVRLPISVLFQAPTSEKLAHYIQMNNKESSWTSLVPIKPEGNKPPLYIVHGSGLTVFVFNALARGMDPEQPVYGLQARGLNGEDPFDNIPDIAAHYISEITTQNPSGPYCLAGYSFGGIVAFEMAKQLQAAGKEVSRLIIFDTNAAYNADYFLSRSKRLQRKCLKQFSKMVFIGKSLRKYPQETIRYQYRFFSGLLPRLLEKVGLRSKRQEEEEEQLSIYARKINEKHYQAADKYRFTPYNGTVDLFRVSKRLYFLQDPEYLGWKPFALKGVSVHEIPGDHKTFLLPPNEQELAAKLKAVLNEPTKKQESKNDFLHKVVLAWPSLIITGMEYFEILSAAS
jgi:amino acid adenylation domain-containing protein